MDRNTIEKSVKTKKVNGNLNRNIFKASTDKPIVSWNSEQFKANKITSQNKINNGNSYRQGQEHRLQNPKNVIQGYLNFNSLRNKTEVVQESMWNNIDISLISGTKLNETFPNQNLKSEAIKCLEEIETNMAGYYVLRKWKYSL